MAKVIVAALFLALGLQLVSAAESEVAKRYGAANAAYVEALRQYQASKSDSSAVELLRSADELQVIGKEMYSVSDPQIFVLEIVYGNALLVSQDFEAAVPVLTGALDGLEQEYGGNSVEIVPAIIVLANANGGLGETTEQIRLYERALKIVAERYGESSSEHEELKATIVDAANVYSSDPAIESFIEPLLPFLPLVRVAPAYPARALSRHLEGYVDMSLTVTTTGKVKDPVVLYSTSPLFEKAAIRAVRGFSYQPRIVNGVPVEVPGVKTRISFKFGE